MQHGLYAGKSLYHEFEVLADVAGGQGYNLPTEEDFLDEKMGTTLRNS